MFVHLTKAESAKSINTILHRKGGGGVTNLVFIVDVGPAKDFPLRKRSSVKLSCAFYRCDSVSHS